MSSFTRFKHNPIELIQALYPWVDIKHIIYNPLLKKGQYNIVRGSTHDGTLLFTNELLENTLINLVTGESYFKGLEPIDFSLVDHIEYTIGPLKHFTVYGRVFLPCSKTYTYPGQKERTKIPVISKIIYKTV